MNFFNDDLSLINFRLCKCVFDTIVYFDLKKDKQGITIYVQFALSVHIGHIEYTLAPKGAYRL